MTSPFGISYTLPYQFVEALQFEAISSQLSSTISFLLFSQVVMKYLEILTESSDFVTQLLKKLSPPLVTLLSAEPEIQYVALRNINIVVQKRCVSILSEVLDNYI